MRLSAISMISVPLLLACGAKSDAPPAVPSGAPTSPAVVAATSPAVAATPPAAGAPTSAPEVAATCTHPGLVVGSVEARPIGSLRDLATTLGKTAASDEEALTVLCQGRPADLCNAAMPAYVVSEDDGKGGGALSVYFRGGKGGDGPWSALSRIVPSDPQDETEVVQAPAAFDDGRYLHVVVGHIERVFMSQCDPEGGCELDSEVFGAVAVDVVIDRGGPDGRGGGRHAWTSIASAWGADTCEAHVAPSVVDGAFVRSDCAGKSDRFTAAELAPCTPELHARWAKEQATRFEAEKAKANDVLKARAQGGAAAPTPAAGGTRSAAEHLAEGRKLTRDKQLDEAIAAFTAASDADPELLEAFSGRGYAKVLRGKGDDYKEAIEDFDTVRTSIQGSRYEGNSRFLGAVWFNLGLAYEKLGQKAEALDAFEGSELRAPSDAAKKKIAALK